VRALAQQQVVAQTQPRGEPGEALGVDNGGAQPGQLALIRRQVGVIEVLGRDQLEYRVAQVLQPLVVGRSALWMLVVVGAVRQRLTQERRLMEANSKRPLEFLKWLVRLSELRLRW
jgi:hypothetical protein